MKRILNPLLNPWEKQLFKKCLTTPPICFSHDNLKSAHWPQLVCFALRTSMAILQIYSLAYLLSLTDNKNIQISVSQDSAWLCQLWNYRPVEPNTYCSNRDPSSAFCLGQHNSPASHWGCGVSQRWQQNQDHLSPNGFIWMPDNRALSNLCKCFQLPGIVSL